MDLWRIAEYEDFLIRMFRKLSIKVLTELSRQTWKGNDAFSVFNDIANRK